MVSVDIEQYQELKEMVRCVQLYYGLQKQQREIAELLGISASRVSRLLKRAHEEGLYKVEFNFPPLFEVATKLIGQYGLRDAVVIPTGEPSQLKENLGIAAARYFEKVVGEGAKVGLSCGNTLFYMIKHLREGVPKNFHIYPLATESTLRAVDIVPNTLVGMMTAKYRPAASGYILPVQPAIAPDEAGLKRQSFLEYPGLQKIYKEAQNIDVALIGVGGLDATSPGFCALAASQGITPKRLEKLGAVGEFNYQPLDREGNLLQSPEIASILKRIPAMTVERMRELSQQHGKLIIGIGGGPDKIKSIHALLSGRICNVLITDLETVYSLIKS